MLANLSKWMLATILSGPGLLCPLTLNSQPPYNADIMATPLSRLPALLVPSSYLGLLVSQPSHAPLGTSLSPPVA